MAGLLLAFGSFALLGGAVLAATGYEQGDDVSLLQAALLQLLLWVGLAGVPVWIGWRGRGLATELGLRFRAVDAPVGLALGVATQVAVAAMAWVVDRAFDVDSGTAAREVVDRADGAGLVVLALLVVVGAPIVEELFFRGVWQPLLVERWGRVAGVAGAAALFAATHLQPIQFPGLFVFGLVAGTLALRTGRLGPAVWAHVGFNASTVVVLVLTR